MQNNVFGNKKDEREKKISDWVSERECEQLSQSKTPLGGIRKPVSEEDTEFLKTWLLPIPTTPSHHCRKQPSYAGKSFITSERTLSQLHKNYRPTKSCIESGRRDFGTKIFNSTFYDLKMSFFYSQKGSVLRMCCSKNGKYRNEIAVLMKHLQNKSMSQQAEAEDKSESDDASSVWTMDLLSVLLCPQASALYYETKLVSFIPWRIII